GGRRVEKLRQQVEVSARPEFAAAAALLDRLGVSAPAGETDLYFVGWDAAIGKHEGIGLNHFTRGLAADARNDLSAAARAYARALSYTTLRASARRHLLACLLRLSDRDAPAVAHQLTTDLQR